MRVTRRQQFTPEDASRFFFFQYNFGNATYFLNRLGRLPVAVADTPHFSVALSLAHDDPVGVVDARRTYVEYLRSSWPSRGRDTNAALLDARYREYLTFINATKATRTLEQPVVLTQLPGRHDYFVVDGNHRCATAGALGMSVSARILAFPNVFDRFMAVDLFYGTRNKNMPYQSIYINESLAKPGRRDDIYERLRLLPATLLEGRTVLDVGSNMGMNSIGAAKLGASKVVGLEISRRMVNFATRFAIFDDCYPTVTFRWFDVDSDSLPTDERYDVAFMLSVHNHIERPGALAKIARDSVTDAVVFEGHPGTDLNDYREFVEASGFSRLEKVGDLGVSVFNRAPCRPLWLLFK